MTRLGILSLEPRSRRKRERLEGWRVKIEAVKKQAEVGGEQE